MANIAGFLNIFSRKTVLILFLSLFLLSIMDISFAATEFDLGPYAEGKIFFLPNFTVTVQNINVESIDAGCALTKQADRSVFIRIDYLNDTIDVKSIELKTVDYHETIELSAFDPINKATVGTFNFNVKDITAEIEATSCAVKNKRVLFKVSFDALNFCSDDDGKGKETNGNVSVGQITPAKKTAALPDGTETDSIILVRSIPLLKSFDTCLNNDTVSESFCEGGAKKIAVLNCDAGFTCKYDQCVATAAVVCQDSDGYDITEQGSVRYGVSDNVTMIKDECIDAKTVREYVCANKKRTALERSCPSNMQCSDGACIPGAPKPSVNLFCIETDNGKNADIMGSVEWGTTDLNNAIIQKTNKEDECVSEHTLLEYYCENKEGKNVEIDCENGKICKDGKCILQVDEKTKEVEKQNTNLSITSNEIIILVVIVVIILGAIYFYTKKKGK